MSLEKIGYGERLGLRHDIDAVLSLLDLAVYALRSEREYQMTQVRPEGLPSITGIIKTLVVCTGKLDECWCELKLEGDVDHEPTIWRPGLRTDRETA